MSIAANGLVTLFSPSLVKTQSFAGNQASWTRIKQRQRTLIPMQRTSSLPRTRWRLSTKSGSKTVRSGLSDSLWTSMGRCWPWVTRWAGPMFGTWTWRSRRASTTKSYHTPSAAQPSGRPRSRRMVTHWSASVMTARSGDMTGLPSPRENKIKTEHPHTASLILLVDNNPFPNSYWFYELYTFSVASN